MRTLLFVPLASVLQLVQHHCLQLSLVQGQCCTSLETATSDGCDWGQTARDAQVFSFSAVRSLV